MQTMLGPIRCGHTTLNLTHDRRHVVRRFVAPLLKCAGKWPRDAARDHRFVEAGEFFRPALEVTTCTGLPVAAASLTMFTESPVTIIESAWARKPR